MSPADPKLLVGRDLAAWKGMLRTHHELLAALDVTLEAEYGVSLQQYEVLMALGDAGAPGLRMSALADQLLLSRSGLTRLVDRLVIRGLVSRERCPDDARGYLARLTNSGRGVLAKARPTHLDDVRSRFHSKLTGADLDRLVAIWERLAAK